MHVFSSHAAENRVEIEEARDFERDLYEESLSCRCPMLGHRKSLEVPSLGDSNQQILFFPIRDKLREFQLFWAEDT